MKHKYFRAYLGFLALEIPSLLQIITLLTLISLVSNYLILKIIIIYLVYKLTNIYLNEKLLIFINNELRYYSDIKKEVVIIGVGDRIELWSESIWNKYIAAAEKESGDIAEGLSEFGI